MSLGEQSSTRELGDELRAYPDPTESLLFI